ncbi:uncharacterized protein LOC117116934 [Anneissia japonica]|uniref:uncharacterized protein LOC117116934 n=1 Tax=Anneissia japonica TaxID=1529436 RepID=UPI0014258A13|nr:uncharacterized protein LOC117116934 [Anneissia japonica]
MKRASDDGEEFCSKAQDYVRNDFYVDDGPTSRATVEETIKLVDSAVKLCDKAGLLLHKWVSNNREVISSIPAELRAKEVQQLKPGDKLPTVRVLGVLRCAETDSFYFKMDLDEQSVSRRGILSTVCSVYDPLGFLAPVMLTGKAILQGLCKEGIGWDDPVPDDLKVKWTKWRNDLNKLEVLRINRCIKPDNTNVASLELHHFSDASEAGYGQCSYLRVLYRDGGVNVSFVTGKARVMPLNRRITIRLELTAAVVSARVSAYLRKELRLNGVKVYYWTDSKVVICYLKSETKRFKIYVSNRVQLICDLTKMDQWKYVRSEDNPSDEGNRGMTAAQLVANPRWLNGPKFIWNKKFEPSKVADAN